MSGTSKHAELRTVLRDRFGLEAFRPHQEEVCAAVARGEDVLLVMPTGSGKSLCYQLPGILRGGTTLVISPLIALIEDQVTKLRAQGFAAERIHSGRSREESRRVCAAWLDGSLEYLYIAPERLSVQGFPEFLARRPPTLIAVDEAHCISHWGHDFRPDYRLLGDRLPILRPAPVIALTATATVRVQKDIVASLNLPDRSRFIRGFWRDNLAVEARDCRKGERDTVVRTLLSRPGALPAIVYVPTRKESDRLAGVLAPDYGAVPYHAGMDGADRTRSQDAFMEDRARVVVATVAFGMGVDKADIRTVIHTALPGSVESYYQEIGRAGRDGAPSRAVLLYGWSDRKLLEFLHSKTYPSPEIVAMVLERVPREPTPVEELDPDGRFDEDTLEAGLKQLYNHAAITWTADDRVCALPGVAWRGTYEAQREHRLVQIEDILDFARSGRCRMNGLVRYFSPKEAGDRRCEVCDHCAPWDATTRAFRPPSGPELEHMGRLVAALKARGGLTPAGMHEHVLAGSLDRDRLEQLLDCLLRGNVLRCATDSFEKEGRVITFQRYSLRRAAASMALAAQELWIEDTPKPGPVPGPTLRRRKTPAKKTEAPPPTADLALYEALRTWRNARAKAASCPAFHVASNGLLKRLAAFRPDNPEALEAVKGIGPKMVEKYGDELLALLRGGAG
ncbi:MAG: RecQ family ATP-dependent DNA helicase [Pseudomonadota bacterium]